MNTLPITTSFRSLILKTSTHTSNNKSSMGLSLCFVLLAAVMSLSNVSCSNKEDSSTPAVTYKYDPLKKLDEDKNTGKNSKDEHETAAAAKTGSTSSTLSTAASTSAKKEEKGKSDKEKTHDQHAQNQDKENEHNASRTTASIPSPSKIEKPTTDIKSSYIVQIGAFREEKNAKNLLQHLTTKKYPAVITETEHPKLGHLYLVRLTPFENKEEAEKQKDTLAHEEKLKAVVLHPDRL